MKVAIALADKPQARVFPQPRGNQKCKNYWFLKSDGSRDLIPMPWVPLETLEPFKSTPDAETAIAEGTDEIGALAAAIAKRMKDEVPAELISQIDVIIVCSAGIDSPVGVSLAGMIKHILGTERAFAFAIGQVDGCAAFDALRVARAFMNGPDKARVVAIVANECWFNPYFRSFGTYAHYGDGAAALLLTAPEHSAEQASSANGIEIIDIALSRFELQRGPFDLVEPRWYRTDAWPQAVGAFLADFLRKHDLEAADLIAIHSPCLEAGFVDAVALASHLPLTPGVGGFVSSVDPLLAFTSEVAGSASGYVLSWSVGLNGEMGASLHWQGNRSITTVLEAN